MSDTESNNKPDPDDEFDQIIKDQPIDQLYGTLTKGYNVPAGVAGYLMVLERRVRRIEQALAIGLPRKENDGRL